MAKKKQDDLQENSSSTIDRSVIGKRNKNRGNRFEREMCNKLKVAGFDVSTTRAADRSLDSKKCDIYFNNGTVPTIIQCKYTQATPNYFKIKQECPIKDKPFTILWKKSESGQKHSPGTVAITDIDFFITLLSTYYEKINNDRIHTES